MSIRFFQLPGRFKALFPLAITQAGSRGDRRFCGTFFQKSKALVLSTLLFLGFFRPLLGQESNSDMYQRLLGIHFSRQGNVFCETRGYAFDGLEALVKIDSLTKKALVLVEPDVRFSKLADGRVLRQLDAGFQHMIADSLCGEFAELGMDTLGMAGFRQVRKGTDAALRGNDPRFWSRTLVPAGFVVAGITGIISLFYIRSN